MNTEVVKREGESALTIPAELTVEQMVAQVQKIQHLMSSVMKKGEHYGVIPGTDKPSLFQPGAQKLNFTFRLGDQNTQITKVDLPNGHREYLVTLDIVHIPTSLVLAQGVGSCSTMETKYRYRNIADYEDTGLPIPADSKERKQEYRKQGFGMKKVNGIWLWVKYKDSSRVENPDIADTYNTVLKMANKRAYVHGTIKATAASDLFTQDLEDFGNEESEHGAGNNGEEQSQQTQTTQPSPDIEAYCAKLAERGFDGKAIANFQATAAAIKPEDKESLANMMKAWDMRKAPTARPNPLKAQLDKLGDTVEANAGKQATEQGGLPYDHE